MIESHSTTYVMEVCVSAAQRSYRIRRVGASCWRAVATAPTMPDATAMRKITAASLTGAIDQCRSWLVDDSVTETDAAFLAFQAGYVRWAHGGNGMRARSGVAHRAAEALGNRFTAIVHGFAEGYLALQQAITALAPDLPPLVDLPEWLRVGLDDLAAGNGGRSYRLADLITAR